MDGGTLQALLPRFRERGEAPALAAFGGAAPRIVSFAALEDRAMRLAGLFRQNEPVGIYAPNGVEWIVARIALIAAGALAVHCDSEWPAERLAQVLGVAKCQRVFTTKELAARLPPGVEFLDLDALPSGERSAAVAAPDPDDEAALFFTSGTTGPPKPVPLTHRNILSNVRAILSDPRFLRADDRLLLPLPLYHAYPFIIGLVTPLAAGLPVVLPAGVTGPDLTRALKEGEVSVMVGVPRLYQALYDGIAARVARSAVFRALIALSIFVRRRLGWRIGRVLLAPVRRRLAPRLRLLASGGAKLDADLAWALEGLGWEVLNGYGLVETASMATFERSGHARPGTGGQAGPETQLRIAPVEGWSDGAGEVQFAGPLVFKGYRDDAAANRAAFTDDGWFRTGDVGRIDGDGFLHIVGRVKEMIVLPGGKKVAPEDVEKIYAESPYIGEIALLEDGDALAAVVVPNLEAVRAMGGGKIEDMVRVALGERAQRLAPHERVSRFAIAREALPRTRLGKVQRFALADIYARARRAEPPKPRALTDEDRALLEKPEARKVYEFLVARFPEQGVSPDTAPQLDLGIDSLAWVSLGLEMDEKTGVRLSEDAISRSVTVRDLMREAIAAAGPHRSTTSMGTRETAPSKNDALRRRLMSDPKWLAPRGPLATAIGLGLCAIAFPLMRVYFLLRVRGRALVPLTGPLIVAPNHVSDIDPFVAGVALGLARVPAFAWAADVQQVFFRPLGRLIARPLGMFPVDDRTPGASLTMALEMLKRGRILVWFPESWRSPDGSLQAFQPGIGRLVIETGAAVVPCWIEGAMNSMSRTGHFPWPAKIEVRFGKPIKGLKGTPEEIARSVHDAVAGISGARTTS
jgi:long-chain acyl-CoA synthetase